VQTLCVGVAHGGRDARRTRAENQIAITTCVPSPPRVPSGRLRITIYSRYSQCVNSSTKRHTNSKRKSGRLCISSDLPLSRADLSHLRHHNESSARTTPASNQSYNPQNPNGVRRVICLLQATVYNTIRASEIKWYKQIQVEFDETFSRFRCQYSCIHAPGIGETS